MIIVTGSIVARAEHVDTLVALSLEHVGRSRTEPGCIAHALHLDVENPLRLVFVEQWADRDALRAHFALPASRAFARQAVALASSAPQIEIYEASAVQL